MSRIRPDALRSLPVLSTLLGAAAIAALALAYWGNVTSRERYLQSRNFRLLGVFAQQTQDLLYDSEQIVRRTIRTAGDELSDRRLDSATAHLWAQNVARDLQPTRLRGAQNTEASAERRVVRIVAPVDKRLRELGTGRASISPSAAVSVADIARQLPQHRTSVLGVGSDVRFTWTTEGEPLPTFTFQVPAAALFAGAFPQARWQRAFTTVALATPDGRIVFAIGAQAAELQASGVASLLPGAAETDGPNLLRFASTIADERVSIAGIDYRMFTHPCCRGASLARPVDAGTPGFVVVGLADADALRSLSLAISPVLVLAGATFVMACLVGWAFLKCTLMGGQQRLGRHDVINMLVSALFGVALATVLLLTIGAYARLSADVDSHLQHLTAAVDSQFTGEIEGAAAQLQTMVEVVAKDPCTALDGPPPRAGHLPVDPCQPLANAWSDRERLPDYGYPGFLTFSMVDQSGLQAVKAAFSTATRTTVDVGARAYYQRALAHEQLWTLPAPRSPAKLTEGLCPAGCYLEYVSAWNTGRPQVVLAAPTGVPRLPVATLSIPMHAMLAPVLPHGFEFAVINHEGLVQFHSDPQRNGQENLLLETDQNSRLRSMVAAQSAGPFTAMYWGYPYRGYVRPTRIPGWSVIVFKSKQASRALALEWFTVAVLLVGLYTLGWTVLMLLALTRGVSWLWPDPLRRHWYVPLGCVALAAIAVWLALAWQQPVHVTAIAGFTIPLVTWTFCYGVLAVRPPGVGAVTQWTEMCRSYRFAGTALFALTAIVPAASAYAFSFDRHIEAFIKERQIWLARNINLVVACRDIDAPEARAVRYDDDDHDGTVACVDDPTPNRGAGDAHVHEALEESVPYFTSASVALRELMHEKSDDNTWFSRRGGDQTLALHLRSAEPGYRIQVTSPLPTIAGVRGTGPAAAIVPVAVVALLMLPVVVGAAYLIVAFLLRRVMLADVVEPVRRQHRIVTQVGQHLQVICSDPAWMAAHVDDVYQLRVVPAASGLTAKRLDEVRRGISKAPASQRIGIADLEQLPDDGSMIDRRLRVVEAVMDVPNQTVLLFTTRTTAGLHAWIRERCDAAPARDRWSRLVDRFGVTELPSRSETTTAQRTRRYVRNLVQGWRETVISRWQDWRAPLRWRARLLEREGQSDPEVDRIATELQKSPAFMAGSLTRDQILEEIEENAEERYKTLWEQRSDDERVLLEHVARHGLACASSRRVVRQLLAARLIRKDPELRLMSESFQRFVLEPERRRQVAALEDRAEPSMWDRLRIPLAFSGTLALVFLVVTQREALDTTVSVAVGVATAVPTLVKLTNILAQLGVRSSTRDHA